jgi:cold shock CspA family protein
MGDMAPPRCSNCGETFNSKYHHELHQKVDACDESADDFRKSSQSSNSDSGTKENHTEVAAVATGTVCEFNDDRGFGFITTTDVMSEGQHSEYTEDIFFHISDIETTWIDQGDRLKFRVVRTGEVLQAKQMDILQRDRDREPYDEIEDGIGQRSRRFGDEKDDGHYDPGKSGPTESDIEAFQDDRKFR